MRRLLNGVRNALNSQYEMDIFKKVQGKTVFFKKESGDVVDSVESLRRVVVTDADS